MPGRLQGGPPEERHLLSGLVESGQGRVGERSGSVGRGQGRVSGQESGER